jgi:hypothetical protein
MNSTVQRTLIISSLIGTGYIIATCPCEQMGSCKKEMFALLTAIPFAFALYNFVGDGSCSINPRE